MKRTTFLYLTVALAAISIFSSCEKNEHLDWKYLNESWLEQRKNDERWIVESNGLQYKINYAGWTEGETPTDRSMVIVERTSWYINGSNYQVKDTIVTPVTDFVQGVQQVLKRMPINAHYEIRVPYHLAYGDVGIDDAILPYTTLIYEIKLLSFFNLAP